MKNTVPIANGRSRRFALTGFSVAASLALTYPAVPARVYAANNAYQWVKHEEHDLMGGYYTSVASSADGSHLIVGSSEGGENAVSPLYISDDYGATWENVTEIADDRVRNYWQSVDISDDGQTMIAASDRGRNIDTITDLDGKIFISLDGGDNWEDISPEDAEDWRSVAIAGDGSKIVAVADDDTQSVYISEDDGDTWSTSSVDDINNWDTITISDNGNRVLVGGENSDGLDILVYASQNGGTSWQDVTPIYGDLAFRTRVAMSSTGDKMAVSLHGYDGDVSYDVVFISENGGADWTDITPDDEDVNAWEAIAMSEDGSVLALLDREDKMYISNDSGITWDEEYPGHEDNDENEWESIDLNASGSRIIAASTSYAYTGYNSQLDRTFKFPNAETGKAVILTLPDGTTLTCQAAVKESGLSAQDGIYSYPLGLVEFCFSGADTTNEITLTFITDLKPSEVTARKYNPNTAQYSTITEADITETTYHGLHALQVIYNIVDNGPLDADPDVGEVADPVGLAILAVSSPNTGIAPDRSTPTGIIILTVTAVMSGLFASPVRQKIYSTSAPKK